MAAILGYCNVPVRCEQEEVEDLKKKFKEKGYSWTLSREVATNIYIFSLMAIVNVETGTVRPA
jgi:hypothetical protein